MNELIASKTVKKIVLYMLFGVLATIGILTLLVMLFPTFFLDIKVSQEIQKEGRFILPFFMAIISFFGTPFVAVLIGILTAGTFFFLSYKREAAFVLFTFFATVVTIAIKLLVNRPRPTEDLVDVFSRLSDPSFPSGHVVHYTVFYGFLIVSMFFVKKLHFLLRVSIALISLGLLSSIAISRVYLGAHWFTDVVGGYLVGFLLLVILVFFYFRYKPR